MNPLNNIISITTKTGTTCFELESFVHQNMTDSTKSIEDKIKHYDDFLEKLTIPRAKINELKKAKDKLVKQYVYDTRAPKILELHLLNYKALLFYFKDTFIKKPLSLKLARYDNDSSKLQSSRQNIFESYFSDERIKIKVGFENFPHLIGIRKTNVNVDEFLEDIFYETKLLEDYEAHKGDIHKIKTFS